MSTVVVGVQRCSFCGKDEASVGHLVAGPGVFICDECVALCVLIFEGRPTPAFCSDDEKSSSDLLAEAVRLAQTRDQVDAAVRERVALLRARGVTWSRIGEAFGMTRQSAWERFNAPIAKRSK